MSDGVNPQTGEREHESGADRTAPSSRSEPSHGAGEQETVDLGDKDQQAEGGRQQVEDDEAGRR